MKFLITEEASITLKKIKTELVERINLNVSILTIDRALDTFYFSFKRIQIIPIARNDEVTLVKRYEYANNFFY
jgi:hypothetical protein